MRRVKQGAATRMHSGRLDPVGLTINFKVTPSRFNHFLSRILNPVLYPAFEPEHLFLIQMLNIEIRRQEGRQGANLTHKKLDQATCTGSLMANDCRTPSYPKSCLQVGQKR